MKDSQGLSITLKDFEENRYSRLKQIHWWDQKILKSAKVLVIGAGALGNEILKNLALAGIGKIYIVDFDKIESSNLSRSVLFREGDEGLFKAEVAAKRIVELNPHIDVKKICADVIHGIGLGLFKYVDIIIAGLDGRESRVAVNQKCWKVNRPWIDGSIEATLGLARVFVPPDGPCYECTMNALDYKLFNMRHSCSLLKREEMLQGKVPTTPTIASIIAGIQVNEAIKMLHGLPHLSGEGLWFNSLTYDSYRISYQRKPDCLAHQTYSKITKMDKKVSSTTFGNLLEYFKKQHGKDTVIELESETITGFKCENCNIEEKVNKPLGVVSENEARCLKCGKMRSLKLTHTILGNEPFLDITLDKAGIPPWEILSAKNGMNLYQYEFSGNKLA